MYCPNCGKEQPDYSNFCDNCGSKLDHSVNSSETEVPEGIFLGEDGTYRWVYEVNLWRKNVIAESLVKVTLFVFFVIIVPLMLIAGIGFGSLLVVIPVFLLVTAILMFVGYAINAMVNGGKYCAVFSMNNEKIIHAQSKKQVDKGRILAIISTLTFNDYATGLSLLASEKFTTSYQNVKSIRIEPDKDLIRVNETFVKNQIYVQSHQMEFVADYISSRCPSAVIKRR